MTDRDYYFDYFRTDRETPANFIDSTASDAIWLSFKMPQPVMTHCLYFFSRNDDKGQENISTVWCARRIVARLQRYIATRRVLHCTTTRSLR